MKSQPNNRTLFLILACAVLSTACSPDNPATTDAAAPPQATNTPVEVVPPAPVAAPAPTTVRTESWDGILEATAVYEACALDIVNGMRSESEVFVVSGSEPILFEGWIASSELGAVNGLSILLRGPSSIRVVGPTGTPREDVAASLGDPGLLNSGFSIQVPEGSLEKGEYDILLAPDAVAVGSYCDTKQRLQIT